MKVLIKGGFHNSIRGLRTIDFTAGSYKYKYKTDGRFIGANYKLERLNMWSSFFYVLL